MSKLASTAVDQVIFGDAAEVLSEIPESSVDCVVTSPPYYGQREYTGAKTNQRPAKRPASRRTAEIGREPTPAQYVDALVAVFSQCQRVLKETGTLWIVLGDKYARGELLGMPWRVALALKDDGWILRSDCIWQKPNAMPSSVKTRPTTDHEYIFFFSKSADYFYDADAIREPHVTFSDKSKMRGGRNHFFQRGSTPETGKNGGDSNLHDARWDQAFHPKGRNKRTVWSIPLSKCRETHFAVFPESLVETCILAGCPEDGVVLDPFLGSGTSALVAKRLGRHYLGIDCVKQYCEMAERRLAEMD